MIDRDLLLVGLGSVVRSKLLRFGGKRRGFEAWGGGRSIYGGGSERRWFYLVISLRYGTYDFFFTCGLDSIA
jgi:hypothetical protein